MTRTVHFYGVVHLLEEPNATSNLEGAKEVWTTYAKFQHSSLGLLISENLVFGSISDADFQLVILIQKEIQLGDKHSFFSAFFRDFFYSQLQLVL